MAASDTPIEKVKSVLDDPSARAITRVYADGFLSAARSMGSSEDALDEFQSFIDDVMKRYPEFARILNSSIVSRDDKIDLIQKVVGPFGSKLFTNFLCVLAKHERLGLLPLILKESRSRHEIQQGIRHVKVTSSEPLNENAVERIRSSMKQKMPFEPVIDLQTDPEILGGLVIQVGDTVYDGSLATRLKKLRERIGERTLNEIQSGRNRFSHIEAN